MQNESPSERDEIMGFFDELIGFMTNFPKNTDSNLVERGNEVIAIYRDEHSYVQDKELENQIAALISDAVYDLASGGMNLQECAMGVMKYDGKLTHFQTAYGSNPPGVVLFKISLKAYASFGQWTKENKTVLISQDQINAGIYGLAHFLSKFKKV